MHVAGLNTLSTRASVIARQTSVLFQNPDRQICQQSVLEEVAFGLVVQGVSRETAHTRARQMIARFGLPEDAEPFALSRGQRQIVALASALACEPKLLVLDEPTSGLDYRECMTVMEAVDELRRSGCAVLMVRHDMEVVSDFATRVIVMAGGRILSDGAPFAAFASSSFAVLIAILAIDLAIGFAGGIGSRALSLLRGLVVAGAFLFVLQVLFIRSGEALMPHVPVLSLATDQGVVTAGLVVLRLIDAALPLALMLSVTRLGGLANACVEVLHLPYRYAFTFTTALRFVPVFANEMSAIMEAQTARGVEFDTRNPFKKIRLMLPLCAPLLISSVARADACALAAEQRGFYLRTRESSFKLYPFAACDVSALALGVAIMVTGIAL